MHRSVGPAAFLSVIWMYPWIVVVVVVIAFKGAIRDCFQSPHCAANRLQHVGSSGPGTIVCISHATHIEHYRVQCVVLRVTRYEGTAQLLSLFQLHFIGSTINRWRRGGNWSTRRKPLATSFRKCHMPEDSSPKRDSNPHNSIDGRLGKQTC